MSIRGGERAAVDEVSGRRGEQLRRLAAAALLIDSTVEIDELLAIITAQARETIGARSAVTSLAPGDSWEEPITTVATVNGSFEQRGAEAWTEDAGLVALVCRENRAVRLGAAELQAQPFFAGATTNGELQAPLRGWLAAPLVGRDGRNLGLVHLSDKEAGEFGEDDESILVQLAQMASAAVEHARLYRDLARRADELDAIYGLADSVARADTLDSILDHALHALERAAGVTLAVVLFDDEGGIDFRAWRGLSDEYRSEVRGRRPWGDRAADPKPFVVDDVLADDEVAELHDVFRREGIRSMAVVPLVQAGSVSDASCSTPTDRRTSPRRTSSSPRRWRATRRGRAPPPCRGAVARVANQLAAIFRSVADGITAQARDGSIVYANEAAARFSGFDSLEEFLATPVEDVVERFDILDEHGEPLPFDELPGRVALVEGRETERVVQYRFRDTRERRWSSSAPRRSLDEEGPSGSRSTSSTTSRSSVARRSGCACSATRAARSPRRRAWTRCSPSSPV